MKLVYVICLQLFFFFFSNNVLCISFFCRDAATVMLSGQVADGLATIFIGELVIDVEFLL